MDPWWATLAEAIQNLVAAAGIAIGGVWAYYRFGMRRESETALAIELKHSCIPYDSDRLVVFTASIENKSAVRVGAKRKRAPAYEDTNERLEYSVDLLMRPVPPGLAVRTQVCWFVGDEDTSPKDGDIEIDLTSDYEIGGETDFWLEPGETYHLNSGVVLPVGNYLAMVTFVGDRSDLEFWRRTFLVQVT